MTPHGLTAAGNLILHFCRGTQSRTKHGDVQRNGNSSSRKNKFTIITISWQQNSKLWSGLILLKWQNHSRNVAGTYLCGT